MHKHPRLAHHRFHLLVVVALAAAVMLAAGCGGKEKAAEKESYSEGMRAAARDFDAATDATSKLAPDATPAQRKTAFDEQRKLMKQALKRIEGLDPPESVEKPHDEFAAALKEYIALLDRLAGVMGDPENEGEVLAEISDSGALERMGKASKDLEDAGYDFGTKDDG